MDSEFGSRKIMEDMELLTLQTEYENELKKHRMQKHLISVIKQVKVKELEEINAENKKNIERAIDYLKVIDYVKMENSGLNILGIQSKPNELSYIEQKAIKTKLCDELPKSYMPQINFSESMNPNVFQQNQLETEIVEFEKRRNELSLQLVTAKATECELLKECAELKFQPFQKNLAELLRLNVAIDQIKAALIKGLISESISQRTNHSAKALKEMDNYLDDAIAKIKAN